MPANYSRIAWIDKKEREAGETGKQWSNENKWRSNPWSSIVCCQRLFWSGETLLLHLYVTCILVAHLQASTKRLPKYGK